jgi:magnesium transporter
VVRIAGEAGTGEYKMAKSRSPIENSSSLRTLTLGDFTWVDVINPGKEAIKYLMEHYNFNPLDIEDALSTRQISKIEEYAEYLFVIFHISVFDRVRRVSSRKQWTAFIGSNFLVTIHPPEFKVAEELFRECENRDDSREQYLSQGSGYLLYQILDRAIDQYFKVLDKILNLMDDIEEGVFREDIELAGQLSSLRRDIINQRQVMFPSRAILAQLEPKLKQYSKIDLTLYFSDLMDHVNKICNTLDEYTQIIEVFKDSDYLLSGYRSNRTIRSIAILLAVGLPVLVVTGINLILPGDLGGGSPQTFAVSLLTIVALICVTLSILHRQHLI